MKITSSIAAVLVAALGVACTAESPPTAEPLSNVTPQGYTSEEIAQSAANAQVCHDLLGLSIHEGIPFDMPTIEEYRENSWRLPAACYEREAPTAPPSLLRSPTAS